MVSHFQQGFNNPLTDRLISGLDQIPPEWCLTPVDGQKSPYRKEWQSEPAISRKTLINEIKSGKAKGYGLRTGLSVTRDNEQYYLMAVDLDGGSAHRKMLELSGGEELPRTVSFTSGRTGRSQHLFLVPAEFSNAIRTKKYRTGVVGTDGEVEQLELRLKNLQSVLPPSVHPTTGEYKWLEGCSPSETEVVIAPKWIVEKMLVETPKTQYQPPKNNQQQQRQFPRTDLEWAILYIEALNPTRVDDYEYWLKIGMSLHSTGDPGALQVWIDWSRRSSKYKDGVCEQKWASFNGSGVGIGTCAHFAKLDGWVNPFKEAPPSHHKIRTRVGGGSGGDDGGNVINFPSSPVDINTLKKEIKDFLLTDYSELDLVAKKIELRANYSRLSEREISQLIESLAREKEQVDSRQDLEKEIDYLLKTSERTLKISDYLPPELSEPLEMYCNWLNIRPEVALTTVLATASSLHKVGTKLVISQKRDFTVSPNMFAALLAESGQKKSPIFRTLAKKPLRQLKKEATESYQEQYKEYEVAHKNWMIEKSNASRDEMPYDEPEPQEPKKPAPFYFNHATGEGITTAAAANPDKTLYALIDELAGYFKSQDAYRQGKGSDKQDVLSYHDGEGKTVLRAGGVKADVAEIYLSIFGTIQPAVVKRLMGSGDDEDGQWARFFFVHQPLAATYMDDDDSGGVNLHERITAAYRNCFTVPQQEYTLSPEAFRLYVPFYNQLEKLRVSHPSLGIRAIYSKAEGHTGVLAINLHVLAASAIGVKPGKEIGVETMRRAIALMKFYIGQSKLLHSNVEDNQAAHYLRIIELSKRSEISGKGGWISPRTLHDAKIQIEGKKAKASDYREWISELVEMRKGQSRTNGNTLEFHYKNADSPQNGEIGEVMGKEVPHPEPLIYKDYKPNGENGENGEIFKKNKNTEFSAALPNTELEEAQILIEVEAESFSENLPHFPHFPHLASNDQPVSFSGGEVVSPLTSPFIPTINNGDEQPAQIDGKQAEADSPQAPDQPAELNSEVPSHDYPNAGDRTTNNAHQVALVEVGQVESGDAESSDQVAEPTFNYPQVGMWVRVDGRLAQVIKHNYDNQTVFLDGAKKGNLGVYGSYTADRYQVLTEEEMVKMKLSLEL